jgi:hypothetical protein
VMGKFGYMVCRIGLPTAVHEAGGFMSVYSTGRREVASNQVFPNEVSIVRRACTDRVGGDGLDQAPSPGSSPMTKSQLMSQMTSTIVATDRRHRGIMPSAAITAVLAALLASPTRERLRVHGLLAR